MEFSTERDIAAERATVWAALLDLEVLRRCVPGCQQMTGSAATGFEAVVVQKIGPVKATFKGMVTLNNMVDGESLTLTGDGKGGPAGFAKGSADVRLTDIPGGTRLAYDAHASVGGKLAQLGSRVIDGFTKKMADEFFQRFQEIVEGSGNAAEDAGKESTPSKDTKPKKKSWLKWLGVG